MDVADSRVEMIRLLIEHGADPNRKGAGAYAAEPIFHCFFADEVRVLLDAGANIDVRQRPLNETPLMKCGQLATMFPEYVNIAKLLVKRGADLSLTCRLGLDAETRAHRHWESTHNLQTANPNAADAISNMDLTSSRHLADWLRDVRLAGGYEKFAKEPRVTLARLRLLCEHGRASPPDDATNEARALERLFGPRKPFPKGVFWLVVQFWQSDRDVY